MSDVQPADWEQPSMPPPRPDPIQAGPRNIRNPEVVALRDYVEFKIAAEAEKSVMRVEALSKELVIAMRASELAISKAEAAVGHRLEGMNEFRAQLTRQAATFATKDEIHAVRLHADERSQAVNAMMATEIKHLRDTIEAKFDAKFDALWKVVFTLAGAVATIQAILQFTT